MKSVIASKTVGKRTINGTDWPIEDQIVRQQFGTSRPEWHVVRGLCNGVPYDVETYRTRKEALCNF